jgi:predicted SAM-dependent methyltransferase
MKTLANFSKNLALRFDNRFGTNLKRQGGQIYRLTLKLISPVRRVLDPIYIRIRYKLGLRESQTLRLHLGCGWKRFEGYTNIDLWITDATDLICDVTRLPWPDISVDIIESHHLIEHISHKRIRRTLREWHRVLKPGGKLVLECPHLDLTIKEYLAGNEERLINIFGQQRAHGDAHLYGFNPQRLRRLLEETGFVDIHETPPKSSQSLDEPSFRMECRTPNGKQ